MTFVNLDKRLRKTVPLLLFLAVISFPRTEVTNGLFLLFWTFPILPEPYPQLLGVSGLYQVVCLTSHLSAFSVRQCSDGLAPILFETVPQTNLEGILCQ